MHDGLVLAVVDYLRALRIRRLGGRALDNLLANVDAIVAPTVPRVAPPVSGSFASYFDRGGVPAFGGAGNLCGLPAVTVPNGFGRSSLPTGLEFMGRVDDDERVIAAARAYQGLTDWHARHPI